MLKKHYKTWGSAIALSLMVSAANAAVSPAEAAKLGKQLTPIGAEMAGKGDIPAWTGGLTTMPAGFTKGDKLVNPFPDDKQEVCYYWRLTTSNTRPT